MERSSFVLVGDIAIIEAYSKKEEKALVKKIISIYPRIKAVLKKESETKGKYRRKKYKIVFKDLKKVKESGLGVSETLHKEHGCSYLLDIRKVFFNPRQSTIREHITGQVKPGERVLVMFSGVGPYPIMIAKKVNCKVTGVELNPVAHSYAVENVRINKVQESVELIQADVRKARLKGRFDRVIMPLALDAYKYLDVAFKYCKPGGVIHTYSREEKQTLYETIEKEVAKAAKKAGRKAKVVDKWVIHPYSPAMSKVCLGVKVQ